MANYTYKEVEDALLVAGFESKKNNGGSHQMFKDPITGISQPVPSHGKSLASGTAESILDYAVFSAYIHRINIASDRYKLSKNVIDYTKKVHSEMKKNLIRIIPASILKQQNINTSQEAKDYIQKMFHMIKVHNKNNPQSCRKKENKKVDPNGASGYEM